MLGRAGSWVGSTIGGLALGRFWLYQDFVAGSGPVLTLTSNSNGSGGSFVFDPTKVVTNSAVPTKNDAGGNPIFTNTAELSSQLVTSTNAAAVVTLSGTPAVGEGVVRIWYLYAMNESSAPQNMQVAPPLVVSSRQQFLDARYLNDANNLSDLLNAITARTNLGFALNTAGRVLIGDGTSVPATDSKLFFDTVNKALAIGATSVGAGLVLDLTSTAGAVGLSSMTTAQINAITPRDGAIAYDSTLNFVKARVSGAWTSIVKNAPHSELGGLTTGDDHTQYFLLAGRAGGQVAIGGTAAGQTLTLQSTSNDTKGNILFGTSAYDEVNNNLLLGTTTQAGSARLAIKGTNSTTSGLGIYPSSGSEFWTLSASGNVLYLINPNSNRGIFNFLNTGQVAWGLANANGAANLDNFLIKNANAVGATSTTFSVQKSTSQTGDLTDWYDTDGTTKLARITVAGLGIFTGAEITGGNTFKFDGSVSGNVTIASPSAPTSYALVLPTAQGAANQALTNDGSGNLSWAGVLSGKSASGVALSNASTSKAIVFATSFGSTNYAISARMVNTTDSDPIHVPILVIAKAATGFTVEWSDALPTANYTLDWSIVGNNDP